jgi:hypothetical protein
MTVDINNYKTVKELANIYTPFFTESSLRQMLHKNTDGIKSCTFHIGGKVFFKMNEFEKWLKEREVNQ